MPYLQLDVPNHYPVDVKQRLAQRLHPMRAYREVAAGRPIMNQPCSQSRTEFGNRQLKNQSTTKRLAIGLLLVDNSSARPHPPVEIQWAAPLNSILRVFDVTCVRCPPARKEVD